MFKTDRSFNQPSRTLQPLWRYLTVDRLRDLLVTKELYFRRMTCLEDAREGTVTDRTRDLLVTHHQQQQNLNYKQAHESVDDYEAFQKAFFVNCWHMNDIESYLMWKAYAVRGVAIVTTYERLVASFYSSLGLVTGGMVCYKDFNRDVTSFGNVFRHAIDKDLPYRDEREFRIVFWSTDPENYGIPIANDGVRIAIDIKMLIESLVLNPIERGSDTEVRALAQEHGIRVRQSLIPIRDPR